MRKTGKMSGLFNGNCRLHRYAAVCMAVFILVASLPLRVAGSQEIYIEAGDTMVLPCLTELWSDQSFCCTVGNPDVLMTDGSGRAVIAIRAGRSDVFVHITNPDTDVLYTFVVTEPAVAYAYPGVWDNWETEQPSGDAVQGREQEGSTAQGREQESGTAQGREQEGNTSQGREQAGDGAHSGQVSRVEDAGTETAGAGATAGGNTSAEGSGHEAGHETAGQTESASRESADDAGAIAAGESASPGETVAVAGESASPGETMTVAEENAGGESAEDVGTDESRASAVQGQETAGEGNSEMRDTAEEKRPYWENTAEGGIRFVPLRDGNAEAAADGDSIPESGGMDRTDLYRECVRVVSDGEVRPVFVCVNGRDIPFKYMDKTIYVRQSDLPGGTVRGGVLDCRGKMYYFSC